MQLTDLQQACIIISTAWLWILGGVILWIGVNMGRSRNRYNS